MLIEPAYIRPPGSGAEIRKFIMLLRALVAREWKGRYRRSSLGPAWAVFFPLLYMLLFSFLRRVSNFQIPDIPYMAFVMAGLAPWTFFANSVTRCATVISANGNIVKKIAAAREVFPLSVILVSLIDVLFSFLVLGMVMLWHRIVPGWQVLWLPALLVMTVVLAFGIGLGISAFGTFRNDVTFAVPLVMQLWLFSSPVMYGLRNVPGNHALSGFYKLNPMVGLIESYRNVILFNQPPAWDLLACSAAGIAVILALAWPYFRASSQYFADVL